MDIQIRNTIMINALKKIKVKGKYFTGGATKNGSMGNHGVVAASSKGVWLYNANNISMCRILIQPDAKDVIINKVMEMTVEIDKLIAHLNGFGKNTLVEITVGDYVEIGGPSGLSRMPLMLNHPMPAGINSIKNFTIAHKTLCKVGKTELTTFLRVSPAILNPIIKGCKVIDIGRYKLDYDDDRENFTISTTKSATESFSANANLIEQQGDSATVEFSGPWVEFFNSERELNIFMRDNSPVVFYNDLELLIKAPFIEG